MSAPEDEKQGKDEADGSQEEREGRDEIRQLEEADEVPSDPAEWPGGKAKYITFGGGEGQADEPFGEGVTGKLGPSDVHHQPDGSVLVRGEKVENPEEFKGDPIPGGPTDPNAPKLAGERDLAGEREGGSGEDRGGEGGGQGGEEGRSEGGTEGA